MAKIKLNTYQSIPPFLTLETSVKVRRNGGDERVRVSFVGTLNPKRIPGKVITSDQDLIKGLDGDGDNVANGGNLFRLVSSQEIDGPAPPIKKATEPKTTLIPDPIPDEDEDEDEEVAEDQDTDASTPREPSVIDTITTVQEAKAYLIEVLGVSANSVKNRELVLKVADENNISFPALQ